MWYNKNEGDFMSKIEFKEFVKKNPSLLKFVREEKMTWQKFYEIYDLYGEDEYLLNTMEKDSTYNKLVNAESSFLTINLSNQKIDKLKMWPEVTSSATPIFLLKSNQLYLPDFKWYEIIRPKRADDLGDISDELEQYFSAPSDNTNSRRRRNQ